MQMLLVDACAQSTVALQGIHIRVKWTAGNTQPVCVLALFGIAVAPSPLPFVSLRSMHVSGSDPAVVSCTCWLLLCKPCQGTNR
jgi:hypothetical protein